MKKPMVSKTNPYIVTGEQVLAFRLMRHNLAQRLPAGELSEVAGACGLEDSPPGSAGLALLARLEGMTPAILNQALAVDKTLLKVWSVRAAPYVVPTRDAAVFTHGVLPPDEDALRFFITGAQSHLDKFQMSASGLVQRTNSALLEVLDGRELTKDELGVGLARRLAQDLPAEHLALWNTPDGYGKNTHGETLARFALSIAALHGLVCFAARQGRASMLARTDQWLGTPLSTGKAEYTQVPPELSYAQAGTYLAGSTAIDARTELARRYLHCYGPSHSGDFAAWAGIYPTQAAKTWEAIQTELAPVQLEGYPSRPALWQLAEDLADLQTTATAQGIRLLPPHDPFLLLRDRQMLVPDKALQRQIWRFVGNPGVLLVDGKLAGMWRPEKKGLHLTLSFELFAPLTAQAKTEIQAEAEGMAAFRGCTQVEVRYTGS